MSSARRPLRSVDLSKIQRGYQLQSRSEFGSIFCHRLARFRLLISLHQLTSKASTSLMMMTMLTTTAMTMIKEDIWTSLSGITGSISLASWIVVLMPQLIENYRTKSYISPSITPTAYYFLLVATHWRLISSSSGLLEMHFHS